MADELEASVSAQRAVHGASLPDHRRLTRLYCTNGGHHLRILADGTVQGGRDDGDAHSKTTAHFPPRTGL